MKHDYYERTIYRHATYTKQIDSEQFIPLYNEPINKDFKIMEWKTYAESFGKEFGAPSRNRT